MAESPSRVFDDNDIEKFYDSQDQSYRDIWDPSGSCHWGYFDDLNSFVPADFLLACSRFNELFLAKSQINSMARVLEIGCGNGNTALWLAQAVGCSLWGIDLSGVRIASAQQKADECSGFHLNFSQGSATALPFDDTSFTHALCQSSFHNIQDQRQSLHEVARVLEGGGLFLFDSLTTPRLDISADAIEFVYDRMFCIERHSTTAYASMLDDHGFTLMETLDLTAHLHASYTVLSDLAKDIRPDLSLAYRKTCNAIEDQEVGWGFYLCAKTLMS